jgi:hypothetical protein
MPNSKIKSFSLAVLFLSAFNLGFAAEPEEITMDIKYVGLKGCSCHDKTQTVLWQIGPHSEAYSTLLNLESKDITEQRGDEVSPEDNMYCLKCHSTRAVVDEEEPDLYWTDGVQCESCHGPGGWYSSPKVMSKAKYDRQREVQHKLAVESGLTEQDETVCRNCHSGECPADKGEWNYKKALKVIDHRYKSVKGR